jgi:hypothetical protein
MFLRKTSTSPARSRDLSEWDTLEPPPTSTMTCLFHQSSESDQTACRRLNYITFSNITGLSAAIRNGKTVGLLSHKKSADNGEYKKFAARLADLFRGSESIFLYFPITEGEKINAVSLRRRHDFGFPFSSPVVQV